MANSENTLPLDLLYNPQAAYEPPTIQAAKPKDNRVQAYQDFVSKFPQLSHVPYEVWNAEVDKAQAEGAARMEATREQMAREGVAGVGPVGAQMMSPAAPPTDLTTGLRDVSTTLAKPISSFIEFTKAPEVAGAAAAPFGQIADIVAGTTAPGFGEGKYEQIAKTIGSGLPRSVAPGVAATVAGGPAVGLGASLADVAAQTMAAGGSIEDAAKAVAITGAAGYAGSKLGTVGEQFVGRQITRAIDQGGRDAVGREVNRQLVNEAMTGLSPKIGRVVGEATGAGVTTAAAQAIQGEDPTKPENLFTSLANAATFGTMAAAGAAANKNATNVKAAEELNRWWLTKQAKEPGQPVLPKSPAEGSYVARLFDESSSIPDNDIKSWRESVVKDGLDDIRLARTEMERQGMVRKLAQALIESRNLDRIGDNAIQTARMAYIAPPRTVEDLANLTRRINVLTEDAFRVLDERVAAGDPEAVSSTALRQLRSQGYFTENITFDWLVNQFGEAQAMSLSNSNATAYTMLTNQLANRLIVLASAAKEKRGESLVEQSVRTVDESKNAQYDRDLARRFVDQLAKISPEYGKDPQTDESFALKLYNRFTHHEENDNRYDTGEGNRFMEEVSQVIESLTAGKTADQIASIDWENVKVPQEVETRQLDETTGEERRVRSFKDVTLGDYVAKDFEGKYTKKVYGRSTRSQKELVMSQIGLEDKRPVETKGQEALSEQELYGVPREKESQLEQMPATQPEVQEDWYQHTDKLRQYVETTQPENLWKAVAPAFISPGATKVHGKTEARWRPVIKELAQVLFESGQTKAGEKIEARPAAQELMDKLGLQPRVGGTPADAVMEYLRGGLKQSGRTVEQFRTEFIQQLAKGAGLDIQVSEPRSAFIPGRPTYKQTVAQGIKQWVYLYGLDPKGRYTRELKAPPEEHLLLGASSGMGGAADVYHIASQAALMQGMTLDSAESAVKLAMTIVNSMNMNPDAYLKLSRPTAFPLVPVTEQVTTEKLEKGGYTTGIMMPSDLSNTMPFVALAYDQLGKSGQQNIMMRLLLDTLVHENVHLIEEAVKFDKNPTLGEQYNYKPRFINQTYSEEQKQAVVNLQKLAVELREPGRRVLLETLASIAYPAEIRQEPHMAGTLKSLIDYGATKLQDFNPEEFVTVAAQLIGVGMLTGNMHKMTQQEVLSAFPDEMVMFAKSVYRDISQNLEVVKQVILSDAFRNTPAGQLMDQTHGITQQSLAEDVGRVIKQVKQIVVARDPQLALAQMTQLYNGLKGGHFESLVPPFILATEPIPKDVLKLLGPGVGQRTLEDLARWKATSKGESGLLFDLPSSSRQFAEDKDAWLMEQEMLGVEKAQPPKPPKINQLTLQFPEDEKLPPMTVRMDFVTRSLMLTQQALDRLSRRGIPIAHSMIQALNQLVPAERRMSISMLAPFMTAKGKFDPDNPAIQLFRDKSAAGERDRNLLNRVAKWAQTDQAAPFEQNSRGEWQLVESAGRALGLGPGAVPQRVVDSFLKMTEAMQVAATQLHSSQVNSVSNRVARMLLSLHPEEVTPLSSEQAFSAADKLVRGMAYGNQRLATDGLEMMLPHARESVMQFLNSGVIKGLVDLKEHLDSRGTWFLTEQRPGQYLVKGRDAKGKPAVDGADNMIEVNKLRQLYESRGYKNIEVISKAEHAKYAKYDSPEGILNRYIEAEQEYWENFLSSNPKGLSEQQIAALRAYAPVVGQGVAEALQKKSVSKFLIERRSVASVAGLDYVSSMLDYIPRLASTIARRETRQRVELLLADPSVKGQEPFANWMRDNLNAALFPSQRWERNMQAFTAGWYMAANMSSMIINGADAVTVVPETLLSKGPEGYNLIKAGKDVSRGFIDAVWTNSKNNAGEIERTAKTVEAELNAAQFAKRAPRKFTREEIVSYAAYNVVELQMMDKGLLQDVFEHSDFKDLSARAFALRKNAPTVGDLVADPAYRVIRTMMAIPRLTHQFNNYAAYFAGLSQAIDMDMGPKEAMAHADLVRTLSLFSGGKTNAPGYMGRYFKGSGLSTMRVMHTMQQYTTGILGRYYTNVADSISDDPNLTDAQKSQARKATGSLLMTQLAVAGLLGLPGFAAALALLKEAFGVNAEADVRKGIAYLAGADKDNSGFRGLVTEVAMNGAPNQFFGVAVGQRLGTSQFYGFSPYEGFNLMDFGAAPSIVGKMWNGLGYLSQGDTTKAITSLSPNFLQRHVQMGMNRLKFGDWQFRNPEGRPIYDPSMTDMLKYAAGFDPSRLSEAKRKDMLISESTRLFNKERDKQINDAAVALNQGDRGPLMKWTQDQIKLDPTIAMRDPMAPTRVVTNKASELQQVQDPLSRTPLANSREAKAIAQTFPAGLTERRSELDAAKARIQSEAAAGNLRAGTVGSIPRAAMIDKLTAQGLTRAEAEQVLRMMGM